MKETPGEKDIKKDMQPGRLILEGFLGEDDRALRQIIDEDNGVLEDMGVTAKEVAAAMSELTRIGSDALGNTVEHDGYTVSIEEWMGWLGCPFKDGRRASKRNTTVTKTETGETMTWSDLHIHLIDGHSFFQGKDSSHRLDPAQLVRFLGLKGAGQ